MSSEFEKAAAEIKELTVRPTDEELVKLYGLFKQATVGDINTERPGMFNLKDKYKWDAWNSKKGWTKSKAEEVYIDLAKQLTSKYDQ